jgi:putative transposase
MVSPSAKRRAVRWLEEEAGWGGKAPACRALGLARSGAYYLPSERVESRRLRREIIVLSQAHPRYGYRRITALLRRAHWEVNPKRVARVRRQEGFQVSKRQRKMRRLGTSTGLRQRATRPNEVWSWDFVEDQTERGSKLRMLTLIDEYTRQCLAVHVAWSIRAVDVITVVEAAMERYGVPEHLRSDNGPEFIAYAIQDWLKQRQVKAIYIKPGSPWENGHIESFHDKFRDECLNREIFGSLLEAKVLVEQWRMEYNTSRPHSSLRYQTPQEVADRWQTALRASPCAASASTTENINNRSELHF